MDLSIVIVNWNTRDLLLECLASVESELGRGFHGAALRVETIVADNGSQDRSVEAVREAFPEVHVLALDENRGYAAANNEALAIAQGNLLLLLNSDVVLLPGSLSLALECLEKTPSAGAAGIQLLHPDGRLQNSIHTFPGFWNELLPTALLEWFMPERYPSKRRAHREPVDVDAILGAVLFVRREVLDRVGPVPDEYFFFLEETQWCWEMHRAGFRVLHIPGARAVHLSGASSKKKYPLATRVEYHRSLYRFLRQNRGSVSAASVALLRVVKGLVSMVWLIPLGLFSRRQRARLRVAVDLLLWHVLGCPADWGLEKVRPCTVAEG